MQAVTKKRLYAFNAQNATHSKISAIDKTHRGKLQYTYDICTEGIIQFVQKAHNQLEN